MIMVHLLWADDLILISDTLDGIKKQLSGLKTFCEKNRMVINELKTKIMVFGSNENICIEFNGSFIEQVTQYKFLGCIFHSIRRSN